MLRIVVASSLRTTAGLAAMYFELSAPEKQALLVAYPFGFAEL